MIESNSITIKRQLKQSKSMLFSLWLLIFFIPISFSIVALDYFSREYSNFIEPEQLSAAFAELNNYRNAMVLENHLNNCHLSWKNLKKTVNGTKLSSESLKRLIDEVAGAKSIICIFFDKEGKLKKSLTNKPDDLKKTTFPPAPLFRRQIEYLVGSNTYTTGMITERDEAEKHRNSMTMQQIFMTVTPVTISPEKTAKNFSVKYGGELYFCYINLADAREPDNLNGFLAIFRGKDFNLKKHVKRLNKRYPGCRTVLKRIDLNETVKNPAVFNSGFKKAAGGKRLIIPAEQRFVRTFLMGGGIRSIKNTPMRIPFVEFDLASSTETTLTSAGKKAFFAMAVGILFFSAVFFLHQAMFGSIFAESFKGRILFTALIAAIFPFSSFAACFYIHSQFEVYLERVNLINELNLMLTQNNAGLNQHISAIEVSLAQAANRLSESTDRSRENGLDFLKKLGEKIPASYLRIFKPEEIIDMPYPERTSDRIQNKQMGAVADFFPERALELLRDSQPVVREPRDSIVIAGQFVKTSSISESLISNGALFPMDQTRFKNWFSTAKIFSNENPLEADGLLLSAFESGPILNSFLKETPIAKNNFLLEHGRYKIKFAFLPIDQTGAKSVWKGEGRLDEPILAGLLGNTNETSIKIIREKNKSEKLLVTRLNLGVPHLAAILTDISEHSGDSFLFVYVIGFLLYILSLFFFMNLLLNRFLVMPVSMITRSAELIARGHDDWESSLDSTDEFGKLNSSFAQLVVGLKQRNILKSYLSSDAMNEIESSQAATLAPGGEYMQASIVFVSAATENSDNDVVKIIDLLNNFIDLSEGLVKQHNGTIDKIIDSTLMIVFRQASETNNHALDAVTAVLQIKSLLKAETGREIHAGISSGKVISGRIGSYAGKLDFTVIGDPVNLAARLKKESIDSNTGIIVSGATMRLLKGKARISFLRRCEIKGKSREFNIYELLDLRS